MESLRPIVDPAYHHLIYSGQPHISELLKSESDAGKILNGPAKPMASSDNNDSDVDMVANDLHSSSHNALLYSDLLQQNSSQNTSSVLDVKNINELANTLPQIEYEELRLGTNDWHLGNVLGRGGFGTVFKGRWKHTDVAIKRIEYRGSRKDARNAMKIEMQQILNELRHLNNCRHDNILPLYGYSYGGKEPCLVYQLMGGGSLEDRITDRANPLTMEQRRCIAVGTARGLQFLHTFSRKPLIHGDIKPANILLDVCCTPKIGDFGLAREGSFESMEVSRAYGTKPFLPVEFLHERRLSTKVDTYSFGVLLFVLMTGLKAYDKSRGGKQGYLAYYMAKYPRESWTQLVDVSMNLTAGSMEFYIKVIKTGLDCTKDSAEERPEMTQVMYSLDI